MSLEVLIGAGALLAARRAQRAPSPASLAKRLDPRFVITPTIALLDDVCVRSFHQDDQRDCVSTPPRTGKSQTAVVWNMVWMLMMDPDMFIIVTAYGDSLAEEHSRKARAIIAEHSAYLGYGISQEKTAVKRWNVDGHRGGVLAAGIQSGITGVGADAMLIDDPIKDQADADSPTVLKKILGEYQSTLAPRVHPTGSICVIQTRWSEQDLVGCLLKQEPDVWRHTNIPAVAENGVPDALGRRRGAAMTSALGYTAQHYVAMRRTSGERTWFALYQGVPSDPEGGLIKQAWFDEWRLPRGKQLAASLTVVSVDPSDSGKGDECGLVASSLCSDGVVAMIEDRSAPMTSDQWARAAVQLAVDVGASEIAVEGFTARETYTRVVKEAIKSAGVQRPIKVSTWPPKGRPRVGDAIARSSALLQALETGTCRLVGDFDVFESQCIGWQSGQHQPDRLAALVVGHDVLVHSVGKAWDIAVPGEHVVAGGSVVAMSDWMSQRGA